MCLHFVTYLFKKATAKLHGFESGFLKIPRQYGENFTTSVQIIHHLQLVRLMSASGSPQWCYCALSMSECAIIRQTPEYLPECHSLLNSKNHLNGHSYQTNSSLPLMLGRENPCACYWTSSVFRSSSLIALPFSRTIVRLSILMCIKDALCLPEIPSMICEHIIASNQSYSCPSIALQFLCSLGPQ